MSNFMVHSLHGEFVVAVFKFQELNFEAWIGLKHGFVCGRES